MKLLEGKVAIVTGAGRPKGMGRASALKFAEQGANERTWIRQAEPAVAGRASERRRPAHHVGQPDALDPRRVVARPTVGDVSGRLEAARDDG